MTDAKKPVKVLLPSAAVGIPPTNPFATVSTAKWGLRISSLSRKSYIKIGFTDLRKVDSKYPKTANCCFLKIHLT